MTQLKMTVNEPDQYAKCVEVSKRIRWEIDRDVFQGRVFNVTQKYLPDGLSKVNDLTFVNEEDQRFISQIQGRTYANIFGLVERFICAKILEVSRDHVLGNQVALEALVRFSDEELKHQEMFRRIDQMTAAVLPDGYRCIPKPNEVASVVLGKSTWAVLALTCHIELFTQMHYRQSIEPEQKIDPLYKDVFFYHWREESQHAIMDELEWRREDERLSDDERDRAVDDLIELVGAVDQIVTAQAQADTEYFLEHCQGQYNQTQTDWIQQGMLRAYRWQYIVSGVEHPRFVEILASMINNQQLSKIVKALAPIQQMVHEFRVKE